jgi:hypothetical protein
MQPLAKVWPGPQREEVRWMEKIITEWRVVETDDGFRIEIKGDKEAMRSWLKHRRHHSPMHWARGMRFGPWGAGFAHHGPWCSSEDEEPEEEPKA